MSSGLGRISHNDVTTMPGTPLPKSASFSFTVFMVRAAAATADVAIQKRSLF